MRGRGEADPDMTFASQEMLGGLFVKAADWLRRNGSPNGEEQDDVSYDFTVKGEALAELLPEVGLAFPDVQEVGCVFNPWGEQDGRCTFSFSFLSTSAYQFRDIDLRCPDRTSPLPIAETSREDGYRQTFAPGTPFRLPPPVNLIGLVWGEADMQKSGLYEITMTEFDALKMIVDNFDLIATHAQHSGPVA